jgi:hypothetical protein
MLQNVFVLKKNNVQHSFSYQNKHAPIAAMTITIVVLLPSPLLSDNVEPTLFGVVSLGNCDDSI